MSIRENIKRLFKEEINADNVKLGDIIEIIWYNNWKISLGLIDEQFLAKLVKPDGTGRIGKGSCRFSALKNALEQF